MAIFIISLTLLSFHESSASKNIMYFPFAISNAWFLALLTPSFITLFIKIHSAWHDTNFFIISKQISSDPSFTIITSNLGNTWQYILFKQFRMYFSPLYTGTIIDNSIFITPTYSYILQVPYTPLNIRFLFVQQLLFSFLTVYYHYIYYNL